MIATETRLNFACGDKRWPGFENSDIAGGDTFVDLEDRPYPYEDDSIELVMISHGLKFCIDAGGRHQQAHPDLEPIMREFHRILKPGGWLRIDDNPLRIYRADEDVPGSEVDAEKLRGFPGEFRSDRDDFIDMLVDIGFAPIAAPESNTTQIPCDRETARALIGNHGDHYSFTIEAQKC